MRTEIEPEWITYEEAQRLVALGRTTLWRLVKSGEIRTARVGRSVRLNRRSLEDYFECEASESPK